MKKKAAPLATGDEQPPPSSDFRPLTPDPFAALPDADLPYIPPAWRSFAVRADSLVIDVEDNVKLHGDKDLAAQQESLKSWGFTRLVIVRRENRQVVIGNGSVLAAMRNGWDYVPVDFRDLTEAQARALGAADNMLSTVADWNEKAIERLMAELPDLELPDLSLDLGTLCHDLFERLEIQEAGVGVQESESGESVIPAEAGIQAQAEATSEEAKAAKPIAVQLARRVIVTLPDESTQIQFISEMINRGYPARISTVRAD